MANKPVTPLFDSLKPTTERAIAETSKIAADFGVNIPANEVVYSPDSTVTPFRLSDRDTTAFTSAPAESLDNTNVMAREAALRAAQQYKSEGWDVSENDLDKMTEAIASKSREGLINIGKHRDYWHNIAKFAGRKAGDLVATGLPEVGLGLALMDIAGWAQKKLKLQMVPAEDRARLENEVMPKVVLGDHEYLTGTTAALGVLRQRMWGWGERQVGSIVDLFDQQTGEFMYAEGEARSRAAREQIPGLISGLGRDLPWHEMYQMAWSPNDPDNFYGNMNTAQIAALAIGDGVGEMVMDPLMWVGWGMGKLPALSRQALIRLAPEEASKTAQAISRRTYSLDDAMDSLDAALKNEEAVNKAAAKAAKEWEEKTGKPGMPAGWAKRQILARERVNNERMFVANLNAESGPATPIILRRTPRNVPESVSTAEMEPYVAGMKEVGLGPIEPIGTAEQVITGELPSPQSNELLRQLEVKLAHLKTLREGIPTKVINAIDRVTGRPMLPSQEERAALTAQIKDVEGQINTIYETGGIHSFTLLEPKIQFRKSAVAVPKESSFKLAEPQKIEGLPAAMQESEIQNSMRKEVADFLQSYRKAHKEQDSQIQKIADQLGGFKIANREQLKKVLPNKSSVGLTYYQYAEVSPDITYAPKYTAAEAKKIINDTIDKAAKEYNQEMVGRLIGEVKPDNPDFLAKLKDLVKNNDDRHGLQIFVRARKELADKYNIYIQAYGNPILGGKRTRVLESPAKELADDAARELSRDYDITPNFKADTEDIGLLRQRQLLGPDDTEQAGDLLNLYARTGGTTGNHIYTHPLVIPEYKAMPASPVELIDWRKIDIANQQVKTERELSRQLGHLKDNDLMTSTARAVARHEDIVRRNLGEARSLGNKPLIKEYEAQLAAVEKAKVAIAEDPWHDGLKEFDESWLPKETKGIMEDPALYNGWLKRAGNRVVRGLYPGSLQLIPYEGWRTSKLYAPLREPMRVFNAYAPGAWRRFRGQQEAYHSYTTAFRNRMNQYAELAGVIKERSSWNPAKDYSPFEHDAEKSKKIFRFCNTKRYLKDGTTPNPEYLEQSKNITPDEMRFVNAIRREMEFAAKQQGIDDTDLAIEDYIRHVFTIDQFKDGARPMEYIGMPAKHEVFASHLLNRTGKEGYEEDIMLALELYNRAMHRKLIMEPLYNDIITTGGEMAKKFDSPVLQTYANDYVDELRGKPSIHAKHIESWANERKKSGYTPNKIDETLMGITSMAWAGTLPMNPRYSTMQISTGVLTTSSRFGLWRTMKAVWAMGTPEGQKLAKSVGIGKSYQQFFESNVFRNVNELLTKRGYALSPFGIMSTAKTEFYTRGVTWHAAQDMLLTKYGFATREAAVAAGMAKTIDLESLIYTEAVNHMFGVNGRSPYLSRRLSRPLISSATQFLSFIPKQTEELAAQAMKNPGKIVEYLAFSGYYSWLLAHNTGIDVSNYVGAGYLNLKPDQLTSPSVDLAGKFMDMTVSWSSLDPDKADKATAEFVDAAKILAIPGGAGITAVTRGAERLTTGEQLTMSSVKIRNLDFKHVDFINNPTLENYGRAISPDRADGPTTKLGNVGGDLIPTIFGQQSVRDALAQRGTQANRRESIRFARELRNVSQDIALAIEEGDFEKADKLSAQFEDMTKIRVQNLQGIQRALFMRNVSQMVRDIEDDPILLDRLFKLSHDFGMDVEP